MIRSKANTFLSLAFALTLTVLLVEVTQQHGTNDAGDRQMLGQREGHGPGATQTQPLSGGEHACGDQQYQQPGDDQRSSTDRPRGTQQGDCFDSG